MLLITVFTRCSRHLLVLSNRTNLKEKPVILTRWSLIQSGNRQKWAVGIRKATEGDLHCFPTIDGYRILPMEDSGFFAADLGPICKSNSEKREVGFICKGMNSQSVKIAKMTLGCHPGTINLIPEIEIYLDHDLQFVETQIIPVNSRYVSAMKDKFWWKFPELSQSRNSQWIISRVIK